MTDILVDTVITCPCCGERIALLIDTSIPEQQYVEDCSVCCRPLVVSCAAEEGQVTTLEVTAEGS